MPKLSIVIPTKNRYEQLFVVVKAFLDNIEGSDYEIVVNDNNDDNTSALEFFDQLNDSRISYYHTTEKLSQSDNTNDAFDRVKGDYVLFIGDDDVVSPYIMDAVVLMEREKMDCLSYSFGFYYWANTYIPKPTKIMNPGLLLIMNPVSAKPYIRYSKMELDKVLQIGAFYIAQMPRVYHGLVSLKLLKKMKQINGNYVIGSCPDMNLAATLTQIIENYGFVNYPLSLGGTSSNSAAGMAVRGAHAATLEEMVKVGQLPESVIEAWDPLLPKVWTISTIYAQAMYEVLKRFNLPKHINYTQMYAAFFTYEKWAKKIGWQTFREVEKLGLFSKTAVRKIQLKSKLRSVLAKALKPVIGKFIKYPCPLSLRMLPVLTSV